uniref:CACTA en-spm transposon protein n=1 Tax=Haemonchus contortus TaxID=6289 RepID=A0A7I4YN21_HAECO
MKASLQHLRCLHTNCEEEELEAFYVDRERVYREDHTSFKVIVGDFMPRLAPEERLKSSTSEIPRNGEWIGGRVEDFPPFIMSTHTIHGNSQFQKPSNLRWTWSQPGGQFHDEIDHIIFNRKFCPD